MANILYSKIFIETVTTKQSQIMRRIFRSSIYNQIKLKVVIKILLNRKKTLTFILQSKEISFIIPFPQHFKSEAKFVDALICDVRLRLRFPNKIDVMSRLEVDHVY